MKVLLSGPANVITGYGNDIVELARALARWGVDLYLHPSSVHPPLPPLVAALLTKEIPQHVDLLISHRCPQELAASPESAGLYSVATVALAWSMWEWDSLDNVDTLNAKNCEHSFRVTEHLEKALSRFDAVLAYDEVSKQALDPYHKRVDILQGGVDPLAPMQRDWNASPFRFVMVGALSHRKNPFAAINAFKSLRDAGELQDAELVLKTTYPGLHPAMEQWCPGLRIFGEVWPIEKVYQLYRSSHVLLAPSWGEGKNRPAIEFATSGGAVAATNVGGHAQWMSPEFSWPLKYELKEISSGARGAVVSEDHLAETMLDLYTNRAETARRAGVAARALPGMVSWDRVLERLQLRLESLAGGRGAEVSALMRACRRQEDDMGTLSVDALLKRGSLHGTPT
jgi:glycosyltransferase involved in cell wall biosynthesis